MAFGKGHHLHLIDGSAFIFRAYHALPPLTRKSDGLSVGAVVLLMYIINNGEAGRISSMFYLVPPLFALLMTRGNRWAPGLQVVEPALDNNKLEKTPA